jgi:hypothetical protein
VGEVVRVLRVTVRSVEHVGDKVVRGVEAQARDRLRREACQHEPAVFAAAVSGLGHVVELVLFPELDRGEVSHVVANGPDGPLHRDALKCLRDHSAVVLVQVTFIDQLAIAGR